jgi:hypothetical protein
VLIFQAVSESVMVMASSGHYFFDKRIVFHIPEISGVDMPVVGNVFNSYRLYVELPIRA